MTIKNIEFIQIESVLDSLGRKQIGVEPDVDSELNFRMWGGKDSTGALTHWLAKNKPGLLHSLRLSSLAGQSQSVAKIDANGNIIRGSIDNTDFPEHNEISGLQGGEPGQYYHVTLVEKSLLHTPLTLGSALGPLALTGQEIRFLFGTGLKLQDGELVVDTSSLSHSDLLNTDADDHTQYTRVDGTRGFANPVSGVFPEYGSHLATKEYVDAKVTSSHIQDNAFDPDENPTNPDNITEVQELTFFRNIGTGANYPILSSEERDYGILLPAPNLESDQGKVPVYKTGDKIDWETPPTQGLESLTITPVIVDTTATLTIEQGGFASIDLTSEAALTAVSVVLTNTSGVVIPVWWFKITVGSDVTLSVKIGATAVGWLGSAITNIALGKTIEASVVDGIACGGEVL